MGRLTLRLVAALTVAILLGDLARLIGLTRRKACSCSLLQSPPLAHCGKPMRFFAAQRHARTDIGRRRKPARTDIGSGSTGVQGRGVREQVVASTDMTRSCGLGSQTSAAPG